MCDKILRLFEEQQSNIARILKEQNQLKEEMDQNQIKYCKDICEFQSQQENLDQKLTQKENEIKESKINNLEKDKHFEELRYQFNTMTKQNIEQFNELQKIRNDLQNTENKS